MTEARERPITSPPPSTPTAPEHRAPRTIASVRCSGCNDEIDPLRAGHVAIFDSRFHYFCDFGGCRARFLGEPVQERKARASLPAARAREMEAVTGALHGPEPIAKDDGVPEPIELHDQGELIEPVVPEVVADHAPAAEPATRRELPLLLVALTVVAGLLASALELAEPTYFVRLARVVLVGMGVAALAGRALTRREDPSQPHWTLVLLPPLLALGVAIWGMLAPGAGDAGSFLAAIVVTAGAANLWLVGASARPVEDGRRWLRERLEAPGRRVVAGGGGRLLPTELSFDIRPGDQVVVEADETVPVDLEIVEGDAEVLPWAGAATPLRRRPGDVVVAGSRILSGYLLGVCTFAGDDRNLARTLLATDRRADLHADIVRLARGLAERWSIPAALVAGGAFAIQRPEPLAIALVTVAAYAAIANVAVATLASQAIGRGLRLALNRGIVYNDARAWELCARTTAAVFCARGTLLRGEPELVEVSARGQRGKDGSANEVLSLAASALAGERTPVALALRRAARDRGLTVDAVRNARSHDGRGVTAVSVDGEAVVVGTRALLLEQRISVAAAEEAIYGLESSGRAVVLVGVAGRLVGMLALQDGLRSGARAAVQHLLDARIEPVLMSSDTRETCEALGRALDIDHLRAEVHEDERRDAVQRIRDTGAVVAVLGHSPHDDDAMRAGDVSVALAAAGRPDRDSPVALVGDDVRDAALALALAQRWRKRALTALGLSLAPATFGALVAAVGLLPPEHAPLAQLAGAVLAVWSLRWADRRG